MTDNFKPHVTVASVIEHENKFLMVTEKINGQIVINQPAGHVEDFENITEACMRETLEETGYKVKPYAVIGIYLYKASANLVFLRVCFAAKIIQKVENATLDKEIISANFLTYQQISTAQNLRSSMVLTCIDDYKKGNLHDLNIIRPLIGY